MDDQAGESIQPRMLKVTLGTPSDIATKIEEALGTGKGGRSSRVKITGDDVGKQLLVVAPEEMMPQIETLVQMLDKQPRCWTSGSTRWSTPKPPTSCKA